MEDPVALALSGALFLFCALLGAFVLARGPRRPPARWLGVYLLLVGGLLATAQLLPLLHDRSLSYNAYVLNLALFFPAFGAYLLFLGVAIDPPLVRPLKARALRIMIGVASVAAGVWVYLDHARVLDTGVAVPHGTWFFGVRGAAAIVVLLVATLVPLFGLVATLDAWRRAPRGTIARQRTRAYALAFLLQDASFVFTNVVSATPSLATKWLGPVTFVGSVAFVVVLALLARALLRTHLFDFDMRIKRGLSRGALAGIFLAAFFVAAAVAEQYLQQYGLLLGGVAVGLLLFALRPLERAADRLASAAMPGVTGSPEYVAYRKLQVYRATLEGAREDGAITGKERAMLDALAHQLGIKAEDARAIEADAAGQG